MTRLPESNPRVKAARARIDRGPALPVITGRRELAIPDLVLPSKKNRYLVMFNQSFWRQVAGIARLFRSPYWIDSAPTVKAAEKTIAWKAKALHGRFEGPVCLTIGIRGEIDLDNALGVIFDGIQQSGVIENDGHIAEVHVKRLGPGCGCEITIEEVNA